MRNHTKLRAFELADEVAVFFIDFSLQLKHMSSYLFLIQRFHRFLQALGASGCQTDHVLQMPSAFDLSRLFEFLGKR